MGVISGEHKLRKNSANLATKDDTGFNGGDWMPEQIKKSAGLKGGPGGDSPPGRIAKNSINATPPDSTIPADSSARRAEDTSVADSTAKETAPTTQQHERRESIVPPLPEKAPSKTNSRRLRGLSDGDVIGMLGRGKGSGGTSTPLSAGGASFSGRVAAWLFWLAIDAKHLGVRLLIQPHHPFTWFRVYNFVAKALCCTS